MNKNILKVLCISFIMLFSAFFINIDGVKADIPYCDTSDTFEKAVSCDYPNKGLFTTQLDLTVYFGETTSGKYCAEIKDVKLESWVDFNNSDAATNKQKVAFDLTNETMNSALTANSCPKLKFVNDYDGLTSETKKFTVSDKDMNGAKCTASQLISFGSECWVLPGENFKVISSEEMETAVEDATAARGDITEIIYWGKNSSEGKYKNAKVGSDCNTINPIAELLGEILWIVDIIAIIILIIMTSVDLIKAIIGSEEDTLKSAFKHLIIRIIVIIILFLLPALLGMIINMFNQESGTIQIGSDGEPFCKINK